MWHDCQRESTFEVLELLRHANITRWASHSTAWVVSCDSARVYVPGASEEGTAVVQEFDLSLKGVYATIWTRDGGADSGAICCTVATAKFHTREGNGQSQYVCVVFVCAWVCAREYGVCLCECVCAREGALCVYCTYTPLCNHINSLLSQHFSTCKQLTKNLGSKRPPVDWLLVVYCSSVNFTTISTHYEPLQHCVLIIYIRWRKVT